MQKKKKNFPCVKNRENASHCGRRKVETAQAISGLKSVTVRGNVFHRCLKSFLEKCEGQKHN